MENLLSYEEAEKLLRELHREEIPAYGIDGFEEENEEPIYVQTELFPEAPKSVEDYLRPLWRLYQIGCRKFSITYEQS